MHLLIITLPDFFEAETEIVNDLFRMGMERLHLRKPKASEEELSTWIEAVQPQFRRRIVLHDHFELVLKYSLGGVHLNGRNPDIPEWMSGERRSQFSLSRSCHSLEEVEKYKPECDYLFLSPIYDSISKLGYGSAFSREELLAARSRGLLGGNVFALGGVSSGCFRELESLGFGGAAVLGDLWKSDDPCSRFVTIFAAAKQ